MKNSIKINLCILLGIALASCSEYDFGQEQYRNEINLLSNSEMIYDKQVAQLNGGTDTVYIVAGLSGTQLSDKAYKVTIKEADSLFIAYNKSNYDIETDRYARFLPEECYTIPTLSQTIKAGETQVKFPILLQNLDKLSPDSVYFLDYRIDSLKTDEYNKKKNEVLVRIYKENEYSTTQKNTYYNYTSSYVTILDINNPLVRRPTSSNQVFPLAHNSVRMLAGDEEFGEYKDALAQINSKSIEVEVGDQTSKNPLARHATIKPYKTIDVVQLTPIDIYDNTFLINIISTPDGRSTYYKEFRLHYKYRIKATDPYKEVKAILRMEYSPRADLL